MLLWLAIHKSELNFSLKDVLFGKFDIDKEFEVINHILVQCFTSIGVSSIIQNHL